MTRALLFSCFLLFACGPAPAPTLAQVEAEVFEPSCNLVACHKAAGSDGLNLEAPTHGKLVGVFAKAPGTAGKILVVAGKSEDPYLLQKLILARPAAGAQMPVGEVLTAAQIQLVRGWISGGALDSK